MRQWVSKYKRRDRGKLLKVGKYQRRVRHSPGKKRVIDKNLSRYRPKRIVRNKYGEIIGYKL